MISKVKTLNPKTKGQTKRQHKCQKWRLGVLATTSGSTQHHLQCNEAGEFNFTHSFMISKVQTLTQNPFKKKQKQKKKQ